MTQVGGGFNDAPARTTRLNYNGYLYATKMYSGNKEVLTAHQAMKYRPAYLGGNTMMSNTSPNPLDLRTGTGVSLTYVAVDNRGVQCGGVTISTKGVKTTNALLTKYTCIGRISLDNFSINDDDGSYYSSVIQWQLESNTSFKDDNYIEFELQFISDASNDESYTLLSNFLNDIYGLREGAEVTFKSNQLILLGQYVDGEVPLTGTVRFIKSSDGELHCFINVASTNNEYKFVFSDNAPGVPYSAPVIDMTIETI